MLECWGEAARDQAVTGAELEEGVGGALVVAEEGVVEGLGVGWAEGGVGEGREGGFTGRRSQDCGPGGKMTSTHANVAIAGCCVFL